MYGTFDSIQCVEVFTDPDTDGHEPEFKFTMNCVSRGCKAQLYGPPEDCYPADAAEFELDTVHAFDSKGNPLMISEAVLEAIIGVEATKKLTDAAFLDASENGEL